LHCIALHCIALHCIALHCIALHCIALHCIALHVLCGRTAQMYTFCIISFEYTPTEVAESRQVLFMYNISRSLTENNKAHKYFNVQYAWT